MKVSVGKFAGGLHPSRPSTEEGRPYCIHGEWPFCENPLCPDRVGKPVNYIKASW